MIFTMTPVSAESGARESFTTEPKISGTSTDKPENRLVEIDQPEAVEVGTDTDADAEAVGDGTTQKKPLGFYLSFLAINILVFLFSLDATTLAVAIPVSNWFTPFFSPTPFLDWLYENQVGDNRTDSTDIT